MLFDKASALLLANSGLLPSRHVINPLQTANLGRVFDWKNMTAHESLVYHTCYGRFQCAKLQVPMDWTAQKGVDNRTVQIALIKLPAPVPVTDSRYGGAVVLNPGGPGGPGVAQVYGSGEKLQVQINAGPKADNETAKFFDVIGFDPRGVSYTTPTFHCFPSFIEELNYDHSVSGPPGSSDTAFTSFWTSVRTLADSCSKRAIEAGIGEYMSTTSVARDIVEIFERHGEWREQEARKLLSSSAMPESDLPEHVKYQPGQEMVQYWGFSYGTVLGATLADLYPDRVERMILDGVVDSFDWYRGTMTTSLQDTDLELDKFAEYCWRGGPENCDLYHKDGPNSIDQRFSAITQNLMRNPIGVPGTDSFSPDLATYRDLQRIFLGASYRPLESFDLLATIMSELENGNATALVEGRRLVSSSFGSGVSKECDIDGPYSDACNPYHMGGLDDMIHGAIQCSDASPQTNMTIEQYWRYFQDTKKQSKLLGDTGAIDRLFCTQWHARPKWPYTGDLNATTAHPILFIGNTIDNVTPIRNAYKMSTSFPGSVVLRLDAEGHSSGASKSLCTAKAVRTYFQTGKLPKEGAVCLPNRVPFDGYSKEKSPPLPEGETDEELWKAIVGVNYPIPVIPVF
ncbi:hypothetical protein KCU81_g4840, partial [Aureobasidium melanogenum]|uniref:Peptidase S33 tripeptidyl aminopeptidase-like C-terminal domain-containing protein n=1 Tax=Aureobasidium melanogenum (strain CBS 110374) TaxID=1043003 RepID=A0A074VJZ0_AURM1